MAGCRFSSARPYIWSTHSNLTQASLAANEAPGPRPSVWIKRLRPARHVALAGFLPPRISKSEFLWVVGSEVPTKPPKGLLDKARSPCDLLLHFFSSSRLFLLADGKSLCCFITNRGLSHFIWVATHTPFSSRLTSCSAFIIKLGPCFIRVVNPMPLTSVLLRDL